MESSGDESVEVEEEVSDSSELTSGDEYSDDGKYDSMLDDDDD